MIKAVIFDVGGVLHTLNLEATRQDIYRTLKISEKDYLRFRNELLPLLGKGKISESEFWERVIRGTGAKGKLPKRSLFVREFSKNHTINAEVVEVVKNLKNMGFRLAIISNSIEPQANFNRSKIKFFDLFETIVLSHEVGLRKPDPEIFKYTLAKLNLLPEESVFVDDLEENIEAARKLGMKGIVFKDAGQLKEELGKLELGD